MCFCQANSDTATQHAWKMTLCTTIPFAKLFYIAMNWRSIFGHLNKTTRHLLQFISFFSLCTRIPVSNSGKYSLQIKTFSSHRKSWARDDAINAILLSFRAVPLLCWIVFFHVLLRKVRYFCNKLVDIDLIQWDYPYLKRIFHWTAFHSLSLIYFEIQAKPSIIYFQVFLSDFYLINLFFTSM